jgi:hypothetical protein
MRRDTVTQVVLNADPDFLRIFEKLPEPPPAAYERVMRALPRLHEMFLLKRNAALKEDVEEFDRIVGQEIELIAQAETRTG